MGLLSDIFAGDEQRVMGFDSNADLGVDCAELGGLTNLEFETLWAILEGEVWDPEKHHLREIVTGDSFWIHQFPPGYVNKLQGLDDSDIASAAATWAATEEIAATPDDVLPVINQLVACARSAVKKKQGLFVRVTL